MQVSIEIPAAHGVRNLEVEVGVELLGRACVTSLNEEGTSGNPCQAGPWHGAFATS